MKLTLQHYLIIAVAILAVVSGILTYRLISEQERSEALEAANSIYEEKTTNMLEENERLRDSIRRVRSDKEEAVKKRDEQIEDMISKVERILNKPGNEEAIDNMRDTDSIYQLFARFHPDNSGSGETGN